MRLEITQATAHVGGNEGLQEFDLQGHFATMVSLLKENHS